VNNNVPPVVDTIPFWINGSIVHVSEDEALWRLANNQIRQRPNALEDLYEDLQQCAAWMAEHPRELVLACDFMLRAAGLAGIIIGIVYFASEPPKTKRPDAPQRIAATSMVPTRPFFRR
jgi:hypothetical protein